MPKSHFKSNALFSETNSLNVDKENGIIENICIAQFGENKNQSYFNDDFLIDLARKGNEQKQGVKARFGHPNMCATTLGTFIGRYKDFTVKDKKVYATLYLDDITKETQVEGKGISMYRYITEMSANNSDMFGNSIVISATEFEEVNEKGESVHDYSLKLESFIASDLVDSPAATDQLFNDSNDLGITVTQFLDENPTVFDTITKDPQIIINFLETYENYLNTYKSKTNMSFLDKLKKTFGTDGTFDIDETAADGSIIKVTTEDLKPKVGDPVTKDDGSAIPDGDLIVKNGDTWVIVSGKIDEIKPKEEPAPSGGDEEPTNKEVMQSINSLGDSFRVFQVKYAKDLKENQDGIELVASTFEKKFSNLAKTVKGKSPDYQIDPNEGKDKFNSGYDPEKAKELRKSKTK
ncbi:hypothetical protein [Tenacibaculum piscium]|uniref:hypothetical protein n=1 Tax=Tenacibaculum piscium TaxID=1458515 RepID=UPI00187B90FE|nr:hypothetical protein [Tenacibaculum piscium]MBE7691142.1 hypothetical protein [Tenacibaculum piscium]